MSLEIQNSGYAGASTYTAAASSVSPVSEETTESQSTSGVAAANYDTYSISEEALAAISAETEDADTTVDTDADTSVDADTSTDADTSVDADTSTDADTSVDADVEVEDAEEEVEEEVEDEEDDMFSHFNSGLESGSITSADMKITLMANQMNTLTAMLNTMNSDEKTNVAAESWVSDASTFSYAGRHLAKTAAGTTGIQQSAAESLNSSSDSESSSITYFDHESNSSSTLSYDEILEKYEAEDASGAFNAMTGTETESE